MNSEVPEILEDYPKEIILKDGTSITLRPVREGDETLLFSMFRRFSGQDHWLLDPNETDFGLIESWVDNMNLQKAHSIVAVLRGQIIAQGTLLREYYGAKSHIGNIRVSVDPSYREKHLATWMLLDLINLAMAAGLETLLMELVEDRDASLITSVKRLGFLETAALKDFSKDRAGNSHNLVIMAKRLHQFLDDIGGDSP